MGGEGSGRARQGRMPAILVLVDQTEVVEWTV